MTTPNQQNEPAPKGSITGYGSWPTVKNKTQADWEASRNAEWSGKFPGVKVFGNDTRGGLLDHALQLVTHASQLQEVEAAITELQNVDPASPVTPLYAADINDMVTCARADLVAWKVASHNHSSGSYSASTTTGNVSGSSGSTAPAVNAVPGAYSPARQTGSSTSPVDYTPLVVDRQGKVMKLRWRAGSDDSLFGIDAYYMALCIYNPNNGNIEKAFDSGNIADGVGGTSSLTDVYIDLSTLNQFVVPGQILFIAHQQIAPGLAQSTRSIGAKPQFGGAARPGSLIDSWYYRTGNLGSIPSSVSLASLSRRNDCIPWYGVQVDSTVEAP
ncbi:hypothetical protein SEA_VINE_26 [Gordonia phage Vine]|uniref:Minor tail protein n=1 Tax=Gordonia phage Vine TaxID=2857501 RepID=A0AAE7XDK2_9CAUD|nr:minor tail protein [Gordonia phage Vine]QZD97735.1 hypothetical protein SEA_VINE_26 [Gordonia phage Vine]